MIPDGPLLWYVNRSTGFVLLVLLTLTVVLGVASTRGDARARLPRFAVQALHRNLGLLTTVMLTLHVASAVVDEYVDIRWWQSMVPWDLHYEPLPLALGIVALDLLVAVVVTSLLRDHLGHAAWLSVHVSTYLMWVVSVAHGLGIGTDSATGWGRWTYVGCAAAVVVAGVVRLVGARAGARSNTGSALHPIPTGGRR